MRQLAGARGHRYGAASEGGAGGRRSLEKTRGLDDSAQREQAGLPGDLDWVRADLTTAYAAMAPAGDTAQVHPYLFTTGMLALAQEQGVAFVRGRAQAIGIDGRTRAVAGVTYTTAAGEERTLPATHAVVAAGVWSAALLPELPIEGTRAHSITIRPAQGTAISPYVLFTEIALSSPGARTLRQAEEASPEIYARPDGEVYCCGPGDSSAVPATVDDVEVDESACDSIKAHVSSISAQLSAGTVERRQACFLPVVRSSGGGGPIVGEATSVARGLVIATGHTCWVSGFSVAQSIDGSLTRALQGICNAPGTAKAVAELIMDGKIRCANLNRLHPDRFL